MTKPFCHLLNFYCVDVLLFNKWCFNVSVYVSKKVLRLDRALGTPTEAGGMTAKNAHAASGQEAYELGHLIRGTPNEHSSRNILVFE